MTAITWYFRLINLCGNNLIFGTIKKNCTHFMKTRNSFVRLSNLIFRRKFRNETKYSSVAKKFYLCYCKCQLSFVFYKWSNERTRSWENGDMQKFIEKKMNMRRNSRSNYSLFIQNNYYKVKCNRRMRNASNYALSRLSRHIFLSWCILNYSYHMRSMIQSMNEYVAQIGGQQTRINQMTVQIEM